ncbi:hypothetical protein GS532_20180 [Rhodococcus hoagii]|nr:hypothetical protein [Prescottella equi]
MAAKILDGLGNLRVREATTQRLDTFVREIATRQVAGTGKKAKTILSGMFRIAVRYGAVRANPVREVTDLGPAARSGQSRWIANCWCNCWPTSAVRRRRAQWCCRRRRSSAG